MFYATRKQQIADNVTEVQALSFYTKAQREGFCAEVGATAITAAEHKKLQPAGLRRSHRHPVAGVFFVQQVLS